MDWLVLFRHWHIDVFITLLIFKGYGDGFDDVIIQGDLDELRFVAFYTR